LVLSAGPSIKSAKINEEIKALAVIVEVEMKKADAAPAPAKVAPKTVAKKAVAPKKGRPAKK
jgi:hypothetical protein